MRRLLFLLISLSVLSGCSGLSLKDNISDVSASGAATVCAVLNPALGIACGVGTGIAVNAIVPIEGEDITDELEAIPEEQRAEVLKNHDMWRSIESLGEWLALVGAAIFLILWLLPSPREMWLSHKKKKMERKLFDNPNVRLTDLE